MVLLAAARVGGILANATQPADFIYQNLAIETNVIHAAYQAGVTRLVFFGSSCIYPKACPQPIEEEYLLSSALEPTNEPYAIAKIAGLKLCEAYNRQYGTKFVSLMPTNLYGPNDNYDLHNSHVLPALIRKAHEAKLHGDSVLTVWGTGTPRREFLHVDDLAAATALRAGTRGGRRPVQRRRGRGPVDSRTGGAGRASGRLRRRARVRRVEARRHAAQAARRIAPARMGWRARIGLQEGIAATYRDFIARFGARDALRRDGLTWHSRLRHDLP